MPGLRVIFLLSALLMAFPVFAQDESGGTDAADLTDAPTSAIKRISISLSGGHYSGATFFKLPPLDERAQLEEGTNMVTLYNGEELNLGEELPVDGLAAPEKKIDSGQYIEARVGFYLDDSFHVDLVGGLALADASLSVLQYMDTVPLTRITGSEAEGFLDTGHSSYLGGIQLGYEGHQLKRFGITPNFGMGFGGIIDRFTILEDKTALFFQLFGELSVPLTGSIHARGRVTATTYSFQTEEVQYTEQITTTALTFGLTWIFDANPVYAGR